MHSINGSLIAIAGYSGIALNLLLMNSSRDTAARIELIYKANPL